MSSMYIRWLIFSCNLLSLYPAVHFLSMWFSGIMVIMSSRGDSASPWKIPLQIFVSAKLFPPAVNSTLQFFMFFFFDEVYDSVCLETFSYQFQRMVSHWSLSESKSLQVPRMHSILADINNAVVWTVPSSLVISKSSGHCTNPLVTVPRAPITIGIIVTFMFHNFLKFLATSRYLSLFSYSFKFTL